MKTIIRLLKMARKYYWTLAATVLALLGAAALNLTTPFLVQRLTGSLSDGSATARYILTFAGILLLAYLLRAVCRFFCHVAGTRHGLELCWRNNAQGLRQAANALSCVVQR